MGNQTLGVTPARHDTHSSWDGRESHWGLTTQHAGIYVNGSTTASLTVTMTETALVASRR